MRLEAPFTASPAEVFRAKHRIVSWQEGWGADSGTLMLTEWERIRRWEYTWLLDVDKGTSRLWFDHNESDRYASPGWALHRPLPNGRWVLHQQGSAVYFSGSGGSDAGDRPFLDLRDMESGAVRRLFRCAPDRYEHFVAFAGDEDRFVMRSESRVEVPNYYLATLGEETEAAEGEATRALNRIPITRFEDPTPQLRAIEKRLVRYQRADGVPLSFELYLPPGYTEGTRLPTVLDAYPLEYSDPSTAGQVRGSTHTYPRVVGASPLAFLTQGYAVLMDATMPVVGDPETMNDTYVEQISSAAEAAIDVLDAKGVVDRRRVVVGGHSYGAFMTANLLAHTDLFAAGIARSGAYNRTLTPFGFQSERRSFWEAPELYLRVSPFTYAHKINEPILLIHGEADNNSGTFPIQSERLFQALRGNGATARYVVLPHESHGYRARESVLDTLAEMIEWADRWAKNRPPEGAR